MKRIRFKLNAIKVAKSVKGSLKEFELIAEKQLKKTNDRNVLAEETQLLKQQVNSFIKNITLDVQQTISNGNNNNNNNNKGKFPGPPEVVTKNECQRELDKLVTKRDLLIRSIKDKIAKQKELAELERQMAAENRRREEEELARRHEEEIKQQRSELEARRQQEIERLNSRAPVVGSGTGIKTNTANRSSKRLVDSGTDPINASFEDQEQRDYEIALRLAQGSTQEVSNGGGQQRRPLVLAPSQNHAEFVGQSGNKFDLTKWKYSDLRDTINTSCDLELLEACKREFHRRLKVYHAWRAMNSRQTKPGGEHQQRAPSSVLEEAQSNSLGSDQGEQRSNANEQRYFRIPFVKSSSSAGQRGWWFAHFDGQWIARQLELHPGREPILLIAGQHDIEMCELSLRETRLTSKRGAEILPQEFEEEWLKHGGKAYTKLGGGL